MPRPAHHKLRLGLLLSAAIAVAVGLLTVIYFVVLPPHYDRHYLDTVSSAYEQQQAQMTPILQSLTRLVAANNSKQPDSDYNLTNVGADIEQATTLTGSLSDQNNLTILPGTQNFAAVSQTRKQFVAMQQYINDSRLFLATYQQDNTYISQASQVEDSSQITDFFNALNSINQTTTATQLTTAGNAGLSNLDAAIGVLQKLNLPYDFQSSNEAQIQELQTVSSAFTDIIGSLPGEDAEQVADSITAFDQAAETIHIYTATNVTLAINSNSLIYQEMLRLKAEHPLDNIPSSDH